MTLTVKEKEHWRERISRKIDQAIDTLCAQRDPGYRERVRAAARQRALESLGIAQSQARLAEIDGAKESLDREKNQLLGQMAVKIGRPDTSSISYYAQKEAIDNAIRARQKVHEKEFLAADPLGQHILDLQLEQEDLLDTVWLATSPVQIKQLWSRVGEILNQQPTMLQQHALALTPVPDDNG